MKIVVLGTGGTIAGEGHDPQHAMAYQAGQRPVARLLEGVILPPGSEVETEQVAQLDSKDMDDATWRTLLARCRHWLSQDVTGVVITHGTDTLEETAFFLSQTLSLQKPVVLTCAMRPATHPQPDGPGNLADALAWAAQGPAGVWVVCAGQVHSAQDVHKAHATRLDAFASAAGPWAVRRDHVWHHLSNQPLGHANIENIAIEKIANACLGLSVWPRVEVVMSHAGAGGEVVQALLAQGGPGPLAGLVVAATGHATVHARLEAALDDALCQGVAVVLASRCTWGGVLAAQAEPMDITTSVKTSTARKTISALSPVKARIALMLALMLTPTAGQG